MDEIKELLQFCIICEDEGEFDCQVVRINKNIHMVEIENISVRRLVFDAHHTVLSGHELNNNELARRYSIYQNYYLKTYLIGFCLLTKSNEIVKKQFCYFHDKPEINDNTNNTLNVSYRELFKPSILWDDDEIITHNELNYLINGSELGDALLFLEIEKMSNGFIKDVLEYPGQVILICEDVMKILSIYEGCKRSGDE